MNWRTDWAFLVPITIVIIISYNIQIDSEKMKIAILGIVSAVITVTSSVYGIVLSNRLSKYRELNLKQFEMKAKSYAFFFELMTKFIIDIKKPTRKIDQRELDFLKFKSDIIAWGNESVIKEIKKIEDEASIEETNPAQRFNDIILALRKDLGHSDSSGFKPFHLFITDTKKCE
ncbi:hypothetical protein SDC9_16772 [bioreactor metagenome]|uniref:Uncharacterized protein n=1 Tax=bioreactor metagenome TaxID=1076179 RepID=A0A644TX40_9ZZZZ|nr:hypothetical protein [Desulfovibrio desulfuricans]MEA4990599.1 hypothetical protein [Desulfovibrio desulfuricans]